jgi:hypothetical protein
MKLIEHEKAISCCRECPFMRDPTSYEEYVLHIQGRICDKGNHIIYNPGIIYEGCPLPEKE